MFKAYDTDQGIDVAWNRIDIAALPAGEKSRIIQEVQLLQKLEHKNIINFYGSWFCKEKNQVVFITEIMTSGTLKSYIKRVHFVKWKIIKRWCVQILEGLQYLHSQEPSIIHRDLKCDNIFINGNTGDLRIGDLGLSTQMSVAQRAQSVLGTPEFMAPELYDENYDEKVDIYAFGMCVLEMVTKEVPYIECMNPAQIYKKVIAGIRPQGLQRIISESARSFIELCLSRGDGTMDVTAEYLLNHPFLQPFDNDDDHQLCFPPEAGLATLLERRPSLEPEPSVEQMSLELNMETARSVSVSDPRRFTAPKEASAMKKQSITSEEPATTPSQALESDPIIVGERTDDQEADVILASMPGNESKVQDDRVNVMGGRGIRLVETSGLDFRSSSSSSVASEKTSRKSGSEKKPDGCGEVPDLEAMTPRPKIPRDEIPRSSLKDSFNSTPLTVAADTIRWRGNRHDIKASVDPENAHSILLNLRIMIDGKSKEIKFSYNLFTDVPHEVASELAVDVGIPEPELVNIVDSISYLATEGKGRHLEQMEFDVWEDGYEPHAFQLKKSKEKKASVPAIPVVAVEVVPPVTPPTTTPPPMNRTVSERSIGSNDSSRDDAASRAADVIQGMMDAKLHIGSVHTPSLNGTPPVESVATPPVRVASTEDSTPDSEAEWMTVQEEHDRELERHRSKMLEFERKKKRQDAVRAQQRRDQTGDVIHSEMSRRDTPPSSGGGSVPASFQVQHQ